MKVLIVITRGDSIGGAQTHVLSIATLLKENGHDVLVCFGGEAKGPFSDLLTKASLNYITIKSLKREISLFSDLRSSIALRKLIKQIEPDVISLHSSKAGIIGRLSNIALPYPIVFTVHGWAFTDGISRMASACYKLLEQILSRLADKIIVVSNYDYELAIKEKVADKAKLVVIHNGIQVTPINSVMRNNDVVNIVMTARFDKQKDHATLIKACADIPDIKVHLLGDGPNMPAMMALVDQLNITDKFVFYGYSNNIPYYLHHSDIFVLISNWEGFPISTLEAMDFALPIVVSDVGGAKEAVLDGNNGYTVARGDIQDLNIKLKKLIQNSDLRREMGSNSKKLLSEHFSSEVMYSKTIKVFNKIKK